ncbi:MAG: dTDP-4-dehydrorhamnose reductase [Acidobacteriota bacterium]
MKILITGAAGMVAGACAAHCRELGDHVTALTRHQLDITDQNAVEACFSSETPDAVINCAAFTDVDSAENDPATAIRVNVDGVRNLAASANLSGAKFVSISTDYVFDGASGGFYTEFDEPRPLSVYGQSKLQGEMAAMAENSDSIAVRTGWIFGLGGRNFLSRIGEFLSAGKEIKAISDAYGTPTYAIDLARRLRELAVADNSGIFHITNSGDGASYLDFAVKAAEITGRDPDLIHPICDSELGRPARRPLNSKLACKRTESLGLSPLRHWHEALESYLKNQ